MKLRPQTPRWTVALLALLAAFNLARATEFGVMWDRPGKETRWDPLITRLQTKAVDWVRVGMGGEARGFKAGVFWWPGAVPQPGAPNGLPLHLAEDPWEVYWQARTNVSARSQTAAAFEIGNEPDFHFTRDLPDRMAVTLKTAWWGLKHDHPERTVLMPSLAAAPGPYAELLVANGVVNYTDGWNLHFYGCAPDFAGTVAAHQRMLAAAGRPALPLWVTEYGFADFPAGPATNAVLLAEQQTFFERTTSEGAALGIAKQWAFILTPYAEDGLDFGLLDKNLTPRPALESLLAITDRLRHAEPGDRLVSRANGDTVGYVFREPAGNGSEARWLTILFSPARRHEYPLPRRRGDPPPAGTMPLASNVGPASRQSAARPRRGTVTESGLPFSPTIQWPLARVGGAGETPSPTLSGPPPRPFLLPGSGSEPVAGAADGTGFPFQVRFPTGLKSVRVGLGVEARAWSAPELTFSASAATNLFLSTPAHRFTIAGCDWIPLRVSPPVHLHPVTERASPHRVARPPSPVIVTLRPLGTDVIGHKGSVAYRYPVEVPLRFELRWYNLSAEIQQGAWRLQLPPGWRPAAPARLRGTITLPPLTDDGLVVLLQPPGGTSPARRDRLALEWHGAHGEADLGVIQLAAEGPVTGPAETFPADWQALNARTTRWSHTETNSITRLQLTKLDPGTSPWLILPLHGLDHLGLDDVFRLRIRLDGATSPVGLRGEFITPRQELFRLGEDQTLDHGWQTLEWRIGDFTPTFWSRVGRGDPTDSRFLRLGLFGLREGQSLELAPVELIRVPAAGRRPPASGK